MSLTLGNFVNSGPFTPNSTTYTLSSINQPTGAGGYIIAVFYSTADGGTNLSGASYGGIPMNFLMKNQSSDNNSDYAYVYYLSHPPTGSNNLVINWNNASYNPCSAIIYAFTGANGAGVVNSVTGTGGPSTPLVNNVTISAQSILISFAWLPGGSTSNTQTTTTLNDYVKLLNDYVSGGNSTNLTAGSQSVSYAPLNSGSMTLVVIEIKQLSTSIVTSQCIWIGA